MMERRISVISVNYNGYDLTCAMIDSLRRHVTTPLEIVIVDNGSARDEAAPLRERYPDVKVLRSERNLGFAGGNNLGFAAATGDYLLLLNNDTEVTEDTLHYLCETLDGDRSIGAVCPKIRFFASPQHIQFAGYTPLTRITLRNAVGVVDSGYRGEVMAALWNTTGEEFRFEKGDRICQMVVMPYCPCEVVPVEELEGSERGADGHGSTGVR